VSIEPTHNTGVDREPKKELTRAERRAIQEKQRAEKAAKRAEDGPTTSKTGEPAQKKPPRLSTASSEPKSLPAPLTIVSSGAFSASTSSNSSSSSSSFSSSTTPSSLSSSSALTPAGGGAGGMGAGWAGGVGTPLSASSTSSHASSRKHRDRAVSRDVGGIARVRKDSGSGQASPVLGGVSGPDSQDFKQPKIDRKSSKPPGSGPHPTLQHDDPKKMGQFDKKAMVSRTKTQKRVELFSHLPQYERETSLSLQVGFSSNEIHPAILRAGLHFAAGTITGSNARTVAMLTAFSRFIFDYRTPPEQVMSRDLSQS